MLETSVEKKLKKRVKDIGGIAPKLVSPGTSGMPDRLVILPNGIVSFVETKKPKGGKLSARQRIVHKQLKSLGCDVQTIYSFEEIEAYIAEVHKGCGGNDL